jgi:hypothetical protein
VSTYERWKYCGQALLNGKTCGEIAIAECTSRYHSEPHPDEVGGWATKPKKLADHPKFVCEKHKVEE